MTVLQATKLSQDELVKKVDAEEIKTLVAIDYNPNKHRHIAYKPQDVMNWVLQPWYKEMLSMNHLLVRAMCDSQRNLGPLSIIWTVTQERYNQSIYWNNSDNKLQFCPQGFFY